MRSLLYLSCSKHSQPHDTEGSMYLPQKPGTDPSHPGRIISSSFFKIICSTRFTRTLDSVKNSFSTEVLCEYLIRPMRAIFPAHWILCNFTTLTVFSKSTNYECHVCISLGNCLRSPVAFFFWCQNVYLSKLFSRTFNLCSLLILQCPPWCTVRTCNSSQAAGLGAL